MAGAVYTAEKREITISDDSLIWRSDNIDRALFITSRDRDCVR